MLRKLRIKLSNLSKNLANPLKSRPLKLLASRSPRLASKSQLLL
jgi:hypothetical protein